jgi:hypothetical protein
MYQHIQHVSGCIVYKGIEMLLVRDHNAVATIPGYCTWYSGHGSLEALYPHALQFRLAWSKISPHCSQHRSCVRSSSKFSMPPSTPLVGYSSILTRPQRLRFLWMLLVPLHAYRAIKRCCTVSRAAVPLIRTVPGCWQTPKPFCSSHWSETSRSLP